MASLVNIEYDQLPNQAKSWFESLPPEIKIYIYLILGLLTSTFTAYVLFILIFRYFDQRQKKYIIGISFDPQEHYDLVTYGNMMKRYLSDIHDVLTNNTLSYEIYSNAGNIEVYLGCSDKSVLNTIQGRLASIKGIKINDNLELIDPLDEYAALNKPLKSKRLYLQKSFGPLQTEAKNVAGDLFEYLSDNSARTGIMYILRPVNKNQMIESRIQKISSKMNPSKSGNYTKQKQIELLEEKAHSPMYLTEIYVFSTSTQQTRGLTSIFKGLPGKNRFKSTNFERGKGLIANSKEDM